MSSIDGKPVRIYRMGMAGTLAYEVHGEMADARELKSARGRTAGNRYSRDMFSIGTIDDIDTIPCIRDKVPVEEVTEKVPVEAGV